MNTNVYVHGLSLTYSAVSSPKLNIDVGYWLAGRNIDNIDIQMSGNPSSSLANI